MPFSGRRLSGYVLAVVDEVPQGRSLLELASLEGDEPLFDESLVRLFRWAAAYHAHPLGCVVRTALPPRTRTASRTVVRLVSGGPLPLLPDEETRRLLERLSVPPARGMRPAALTRYHGISERTISRALRDGLIDCVQAEGAAVAQVKVEEFYSLSCGADEARRLLPRPGPVRDRLVDWLARMGPVSRAALKEAFPTGGAPLRQLREMGLVRVEERSVDPLAAEQVAIRPEDRVRPPTTEAQQAALGQLLPALDDRSFAAFLLYGVTGSGKTEVYLQVAAHVLEQGGGAVLLVPEIGLTPQFLGRFRARFGTELVAVLHSGLTPRERFDEWTRIASGKARLAIGPRSAVFAPVRDLRLLVVDEEHDGSYKQDDGLRYNARDLAVVRAQQAEALCVLGSATPSLESYRAAQEGRYLRIDLPQRVMGRPMPEVELIDLRRYPVSDPDSPAAALSPPLREAIDQNRKDGGQAILLLNRRGFATTVICTACGVHFRCDDCDVSLTYHARRHQMVCHWCGASRPLPEACPDCRDPQGLKAVGRGTERLEEELLALWPGLRVDRMDADTTRSRAGHRIVLDRFRDGLVDVLVGTQMVAKGHDFPGVTLVGILHADAALHLPDFRASERTFQLVAQVAGRAGRGDRPGRVLVQTWHPGHHAIRLAVLQDFEAFAERELRLRRSLDLPPFSRLLLATASAGDERAARDAAAMVRQRIDETVAADERCRVGVRGPAPAPMYRVAGQYRWQVLVRGETPAQVGRLLRSLAPAVTRGGSGGSDSRARIVLDRDPMGLM